MKKYFSFLWMLSLTVLLWLGGAISYASEDEYSIVMTGCTGYTGSEIQIKVTLPDAYGTWAVFRGTQDPAAGGTLAELDSISSGVWYGTGNDNEWYRYGDQEKIVCVTADVGMTGSAVFYDITAELGVTYYYQIALERDSSVIAVSNVMSASTKLDTPEFCKAYAKTNSSVILKWAASSEGKGYQIYRKDGSKWKRIKTIKKATTITYTDKTAKAGKTYYYRIRAYGTVNGKKVYSAYSSSVKIKMKNPTVKGTYSKGSVYGPSLSTSKLAEVRRVVQGFKDNYITSGMSDYEKVATAFAYLRYNCSYAWRGWQYNGANTAWGALVYGEAQCSGYARAMKALCDAMGVKCYYVHANSKASNPSHQWNQVRVGGKWYIVDAQGGAFLVGSSTYQNTFGMKWNTSGLPKCSKKDYIKGGLTSSE